MAVALAQLLPGAVVINADASQVYADLTILSARPTTSEMGGIEHRLFGHIDGSTAYSAAAWASDARSAIIDAHAAGLVPIIVGGTGLYLRTLLDGIAPVPAIDPDIRCAVRAMPVAQAYAALAREDRAASRRIGPNDAARVARALEVMRSTGKPLATWQEQREGGIAKKIHLVAAILLPPRERLRARCDTRLEAMFAAGAAEEVRRLVARNLSPDLPVMRAIGVPQIAVWLAGGATEEAALIAAQAATRQYAKRQYTWLRHQPPADWLHVIELLSVTNIDKFAIILRNMLLTG